MQRQESFGLRVSGGFVPAIDGEIYRPPGSHNKRFLHTPFTRRRWIVPSTAASHNEEEVPIINVKLIEGVFTADEKEVRIEKLTDAMVSIEGEAMRQVTWVVVEESGSGDWGLGGKLLHTADVLSIGGAPVG